MNDKSTDNSGAQTAEPLVKRGYIFLEDSDWNKAEEYFDRALDINPEYAPAYIGKLCVELNVRGEDALGDYNELRRGKRFNKPLGEYGNFQKAIRFAEAEYREKLNGYEQKIKDSFPKIPKQFTDEFINGEITRLKSEIANCDKEIAENEKNKNSDQYLADVCSKELRDAIRSGMNIGGESYADAEKWLMENSPFHRQSKENVRIAEERMAQAKKNIDEYTRRKNECETKKREIEYLASISCLDRIDVYYNRLVEAMQKTSKEDEYKNLAEQFRSLEGYKDSVELVVKCDKLADESVKRAIKKKYENLILEKNSASSENKFKELAQEFRKMGNYENCAQLAEECKRLAVKAKYDGLVQEKNSASSENKFKQLAEVFRVMGDYENCTQLAEECDEQYRLYKRQREERERVEQERKAEQEERDREILRRREVERQAERKKIDEQKRMKKLVSILLAIVPIFIALIFYGLKQGTLAVMPAVIFCCGPLAILHFRGDMDVLEYLLIGVVVITIIILTYVTGFFGFPFMVTALIMAWKFPLRYL